MRQLDPSYIVSWIAYLDKGTSRAESESGKLFSVYSCTTQLYLVRPLCYEPLVDCESWASPSRHCTPTGQVGRAHQYCTVELSRACTACLYFPRPVDCLALPRSDCTNVRRYDEFACSIFASTGTSGHALGACLCSVLMRRPTGQQIVFRVKQFGYGVRDSALADSNKLPHPTQPRAS